MTNIAETLSDVSPPEWMEPELNNIQNMSENEYGRWQAASENNKIGKLNETDGIDCPRCKNKGRIYRWDSKDKTMYVANCDCWKTRNSIRRLQATNICRDWRDKTFDAFEVSAEWQAILKRRVKAYADAPNDRWLLLTGQSGCGKTHLATAAFVEIIRRDCINGEYVRWADFAEKSYSRYDADETEISVWTSVDLLYIDDLFKKRGNAPVTDREFDVTLSLIDARYTDPDKLTIISTERSISDLREMDEALAGRIQERCGRGKTIIQVKKELGRNYRLRDVTEI